MNDLATYTFIPWVRQGLANQITGSSGSRATIPIDLTIEGTNLGGDVITLPPLHKDIEIYGPGDLIGLDSKAIIKVEPEPNITNFEPNYLPYIDFYDEDLPWRYSPVTPDGHKLQPWIMLIVLKENEFKEGKNIKDRPLPYIELSGDPVLPPSNQLWAWAHVHINQSLIEDEEVFVSENMNAIQSKLAELLTRDPDMGYSRIICPRRLEDNEAYHAFLVPTYESGILAGSGQDPTTVAASDLAWTDSVIPTSLPYYHRWYFRTGTVGDFEYLVRLLEPKPIDSRVGNRDMDVQRPGVNIKGIVDAPTATDEQKLHGVLKLGGALRVPDIFYTPEEFEIVEKYRNWATLNKTQPYPHDFQSGLASFINLADGYEESSAADTNASAGIDETISISDPQKEFDIGQNPDPLITSPLYGRWHALTKRLLKQRDGSDVNPDDNWIHELNLDPRWRVAAGFGTKVIQDNQESYMKFAWDQVGEVLEANQKIREAQFAKEAAWIWHQVHMKQVQETTPEKWLSLAAPLQTRVINQGFTVFHEVNQSKVPRTLFSASVRKMLRPRGKIMKKVALNGAVNANNLIQRVNEGKVSAAPPRVTPPHIRTLKDYVDQVEPKNIPGFLKNWLRKHPWIKWILLVLIVILLVSIVLSTSSAFVAFALAAVGILAFIAWRLFTWERQLTAVDRLLEQNQTPESVADLPGNSNFTVTRAGESIPTRRAGADSPEAIRFKSALKDLYQVLQNSASIGATPVKPPLELTTISQVMFEKLSPELTIPNWIKGSISIPGRIFDLLPEKFVEAMAYPRIDLPMFKPLAETSTEMFLPNMQFIEQNSISLLETNQKFIESYMVGLNHEFARELLWREYPSDQRGSYFRQFWDVKSFIDNESSTADELREKLYDCPEYHLWSKFSDLGDHDHREKPGENEEEVVLVIRGELLKKYPNAVIYAHKAVWRDKDGKPILDSSSGQEIDRTRERDLKPLPEGATGVPDPEIILSPLYEAKVEPDIYFFGFDLTVCKAKGGTGSSEDPVDERCASEGVTWDDPGWFFVIKERPGEPRFGLDVGNGDSDTSEVKTWSDLSWDHIQPPVAEGAFIRMPNVSQQINLNPLASDGTEVEKEQQKSEDENINWNLVMSSAELAYILYQVPVLVGVHATEMLPKV
ncbi:MAG: hypothetical protein OER04_11465 [Cyclobacteriaceae bacterium]|nr:hypothetical protein [Cyclobacteriaceae bacterium]